MSRYLYEHLFLGFLYFEADTERRSLSHRAVGHPARQTGLAASRRAVLTTTPGVPVYYRLRPEREDDPREDAHALRALARRHGEVPEPGSWWPL